MISRRSFLKAVAGGLVAAMLPDLEVLADELKTSQRNISQKGTDLIKIFEGFSPKEYLCPAGKRTIGYGHLIREEERFNIIAEQEAEKILRNDVSYAASAVRRNVKVDLTQGQYDALCSFVYNLGEGNLRKSTLLKKLNSRDYNGASHEFGRWVYGNGKKLKGLENRREAETKMFLEK